MKIVALFRAWDERFFQGIADGAELEVPNKNNLDSITIDDIVKNSSKFAAAFNGKRIYDERVWVYDEQENNKPLILDRKDMWKPPVYT